jgi:hypothetical protein
MALILDTKFLIAHTFPPSDEERRSIANFLSRISKEKLIIPLYSHYRVYESSWNKAGSRTGQNKAQAMDS